MFLILLLCGLSGGGGALVMVMIVMQITSNKYSVTIISVISDVSYVTAAAGWQDIMGPISL